ncbi:arginine decarboxylase [Bacillus methanolicus]|uniref:aminotransferase class I/II-fold pyridoxal phosphate-dependent enzyme n=1 Tax=Bacillus methanolicus TaxID=1471 RepID=UPI00200F07DB|nr:aminotransferase class I/II-fold pyridoxal phosphate-dependent enzyme [Bacillus methanolicus]UQD50649.1 arginine decarboxylase [Bacillus methanolicus]
MDQTITPLYHALLSHNNRKPISFHVPGHKYGHVFPEEGVPFYKEILKIDATELTGLDDLHSPEGVIYEAEELLSNVYETQKSFFLVNGTTGGILAMILAAAGEDDVVLVQRNCHKSILNGIALAKAAPVYLGPEFDHNWKIAGSVSYETVEKAIHLYPNAKAIILTYPNYYGLVYDLEKIIRLAHRYDIPVLIDEAHGAHFIAGEPFPKSALQLGADIVVQSAHKTLPAMTMGSFLHFNSKFISQERLVQYLQIVQSSSPSYPIMASLDLARSYIGTYNKADREYVIGKIDQLIDKLRNIDKIKVLSYQEGDSDPLKITIQTNCSLNGFELQKRFEEQGVYSELADPYNVLLVLPLLKAGHDYPFEQAAIKIAKALEEVPFSNKNRTPIFYSKQAVSEPAISRRAMNRLTTQWISLADAANQISAEFVIPYPPGIPFLFPGELITNESIEQLQFLLKSGARFQGGERLKAGEIKVYKV